MKKLSSAVPRFADTLDRLASLIAVAIVAVADFGGASFAELTARISLPPRASGSGPPRHIAGRVGHSGRQGRCDSSRPDGELRPD